MIKKRILICILICLAAAGACGCGSRPASGTSEESACTAYYLNLDEDDLIPFSCVLESEEIPDQVQELVAAMQKAPDTVDSLSVIPTDVQVESITYEEHNVTIGFGANYREMDVAREVLCRGAIVQSLCQLEGVDSVTFLVDGDPLTDAYGEETGPMTKVSFLSSDGSDFTSYKVSETPLYFAKADGSGLAAVRQRIRYNTVNPVERQIVKNLIEGPEASDLLATMPEGTRLLGISISDDICYVNLSAEFLNRNPALSDEAVVYSIVNSLVEGTEAEQVQIAVGGNTDNAYGSVNLSIPLSEDLSLVTEE